MAWKDRQLNELQREKVVPLKLAVSSTPAAESLQQANAR
jgi:hypothetical protein